MDNVFEPAYWMALSHLQYWGTEKINRLIIDILVNKKISFSDFFNLDVSEWQAEFNINEKHINELLKAKSELANYSFLAESLFEQGFKIITINSKEYSNILKGNLKTKQAPSILYVKGNIKLLNESTIAIVGSRKASDVSLEFTKNIAKDFAKNYQVVVSGFAKGVDKMALDATLEYNGHSIIVLPQGIKTFASGFKKYYQKIIQGDVLVLSTFHPNVPWSVGLAMQRNTYIYGLAEKIYVAESDSKGGTWAGVSDGLKRDREIYVRLPEPGEKNANNLLILQGAIPVDFYGNEILGEDDLSQKLKQIINNGRYSADEIKNKLHLNIDTKQLSKLLSGLNFIVSKKINSNKYFMLKDEKKAQADLFV
ncbi:DNA-protecting protein DprA [candidate division KSB1 bacterium]|nr:DNA-protecting protein DprA [candidate division KSB1 bacterium]MBL7093930.1 DNA-protecting protein DprA [candidate division KSB1 bacterium]